MKHLAATLVLSCFPLHPALADDIGDSIARAQQSWQAADTATTEAELKSALQALGVLRTQALEALLPEATPGWTRTLQDNSGGAAAMALVGGGIIASAEYTGDAGAFTVTLTTDSPMMEMVIGMFSNTFMLAAMGKIDRIRDRDFIVEDSGNITGVLGDKILLQVSGTPAEAMRAHVEAMDLGKLAEF